VRTQYRELAKRYHPDAGGSHADFLALQQAYEQVMAYLQTRN
jgi:curved DNA-binding protein CbpA